MAASSLIDLKQHIRVVPDWPKKGIQFQDVSTLLLHPPAFQQSVRQLAEFCQSLGATAIMGLESRGFIFGAPIATQLGLPFVLGRKPKKLPYKTLSVEYKLEYGTDRLEIHADALKKEDKVVIIDDLLATGGTAEAAGKLVELAGATVAGFGFVVELVGGFSGKNRLHHKWANVTCLTQIPVTTEH